MTPLLQPALSRRTLLTTGVSVAALSTLTGCFDGGSRTLLAPERFTLPLAIPPLDEGVVGADGVREFHVVAQPGTTDFGGPSPTPTWGFSGDYLGPTLRARVGESVRVNVTNDLDETTTVHWHGMHLPAAMDGGPHQPIHPGEEWTPEWTIDQQPATLWYHPHPHGDTEQHVYNGLAGMFILDGTDGPDTRLPHTYGVDDVPVIIQDKLLDDDSELDLDNNGNEVGLLGNRVVANGVWGGYLEVSSRRLRLRLLNGSTARTYDLGFDDDRPFDLVATDGGLLPRPVATSRVQLSPGERAEIVVAVRPGDRVRLTSFGAELGDVVAASAFGGGDVIDVLELRARYRLVAAPPPPTELATLERLDPDAASETRSFELEGREINGERMDMQRVDEVVTLGATEIWEVRNRNLFPHNFHVHDVQFQVLSIDGQAPPPYLAGWKDTVYLAPRKTYRLIMRFEDYADPNLPYMFHCHLLLHEDDGMMGQFVVVEPGDEAGRIESEAAEDDGHAHDH